MAFLTFLSHFLISFPLLLPCLPLSSLISFLFLLLSTAPSMRLRLIFFHCLFLYLPFLLLSLHLLLLSPNIRFLLFLLCASGCPLGYFFHFFYGLQINPLLPLKLPLLLLRPLNLLPGPPLDFLNFRPLHLLKFFGFSLYLFGLLGHLLSFLSHRIRRTIAQILLFCLILALPITITQLLLLFFFPFLLLFVLFSLIFMLFLTVFTRFFLIFISLFFLFLINLTIFSHLRNTLLLFLVNHIFKIFIIIRRLSVNETLLQILI